MTHPDYDQMIDFTQELVMLAAKKYEFSWLQVIFIFGLLTRGLADAAPMPKGEAMAEAMKAFENGREQRVELTEPPLPH